MATPGQPTLYAPRSIGARSARSPTRCPTHISSSRPEREATLGFGRDDGAGNDAEACKFWLSNRQPQYWQLRAEAPPEPEVADDMAALLDAAGESMRHAAE
jgi:hypothetical protein